MTDTKEKTWRPDVGSLVVIFQTGCSGRVTKIIPEAFKFQPPSQTFQLKLDSALYLHGVGAGTKVEAKEGDTIQVKFTPSYEKRVSVCVIHEAGYETISYDADDKERTKWSLVRHPNDGAPDTDEFAFNHWVCWDDGEHEGYDPEFRGGHNYDFQGAVPCANVKVGDACKFLKDKIRVEEAIGGLTDKEWERYLEWLEKNSDTSEFSHHYTFAVEDARRSLGECLEGTGLEHGFGGCSGGYVCFTNVCDEETWALKALSELEESQLAALCERDDFIDFTDELMKVKDALEDREENALLDGDKAVVKSAMASLEKTATDEVAYQYMSNVARAFDEMLSEEKAEKTEQTKRNEARGVISGFIGHNFAEITKVEAVAALNEFDTRAEQDGWNWAERCDEETRKKEQAR